MLLSAEIFLRFANEEGQIVSLLFDGPKKAGDIYAEVRASQPIVSKRLARMLDENMIVCKRDPNDRRIVWYALSETFEKYLQTERDRMLMQRGIVL